MAFAGDEWTLGPQTFVAVGTLFLGVVTLLLALLTRKLARASAADVEAQWRPALLPLSVFADERHWLVVTVDNDGRGPALDVEGFFEAEDDDGSEIGGETPAIISISSHAEPRRIEFQVLVGSALNIEVGSVRFDYCDLAGARSRTVFGFRRHLEDGPGRFQIHRISVMRVEPQARSGRFRDHGTLRRFGSASRVW